ncbi:interferon-induced very large GTPase 1-like [Brachionus plicatilis]|uniref:Interferon-induced very large GTPase 1-like n=1 Tax=Brachionus plicatilis TaxID=10195 RepID=A0A3M7Q937_BRAPC|nr:interferon-induced very large GTPase 1-like [Brachionus plicatilis]
MNNLFKKILDFELNDSTIEKLQKSYIDLSALIDLTETDLNQFGITLGGNNMKNDLNKINSFVKEAQRGNGLENSVIEKLVENDIRFENFLTFSRSDFENYGFAKGTSIKLCNKVRLYQNEREDLNEIKNTQFIKFLDLKKMLSSESPNPDQFEIEFNKIVLEELNAEDLVEWLKNVKSLPLQLKPFLLDNLKRIKRFDSIINQLSKIAYSHANTDSKTKQLLELITEKDLVICILESIGKQSLERLGYLLSKNDYPLPLLYETYDDRNNCLKEKINFQIFKDLLCFTSKPLAIISGTSSSIRKGKSSLIPFMFAGLNKNSVFGVRKNTPVQNSIDIICNEESSNNWIIADFNGELTGQNMVNLFKSLSANASLHILNANIDDFDEQNGEPKNEIMNIFNHYRSLNANNQLKLVLLIRDSTEKYSNFLELIKERVNAMNSNISILIVENWFNPDLDDEILKIKKDEFKQNFQNIIEQTETQKFHSIQDVQSNYHRLKSNLEHFISDSEETWVEKKFNELFGQKGEIKIEALREMFKLSDVYKNIEINENKLFRLNSQENDLNERKRIHKILDELNYQLKNIEPKSDAIKFFIKILESKENFMTDLSIFEKCLINFKKEELKIFRKQREKLSNEFSILDNKIKIEQSNIKNDNLKEQMKKKKTELQELDEKIKAIDLTLDKFWDELFLYFDWLDQFRKADKDLKDLVIDRYIKLVQNGYSIHLLRGSPLSVKSNLLKQIMDKLVDYKNIYVISVIGEQSSAKSSLLNSLFGCDFRTSAGRCTIGIYMNFVTYGDKTIVILDTEGLASVESSSKLFDNQMATMAVFSSHLIVINHKGEISSNLEKILGITFFAKLNLANHSFKPLIMFVLRDQIDRSESSINGQVSKLKEGLIKESRFVGTSLDDVLNLDPKHITLLSNAFSEDYCNKLNIKIKWRNKIFPDEVLELRKKLMQQIDLVNEENVIKNFPDLYSNLSSHWETISKTGENIFNCKDLEEIKIRDEISAKSNDLLTKHRTELAKILDDLINQIINSYKEKQIFDNSIETQCKHDIERCVEERKEKVNQEFDSLRDVSFYPKSIVDEYGKRISYQFEWLKDISIQRLNENCIYLKNMSEYKNVNQKIIDEINDLLAKNNHYDNINAFIRDIEKKFEKIDQENNVRLNSMNRSVDIENIERMFKDISSLIVSQNRRFHGIENNIRLRHYYLNDFKKGINVENWYSDGIWKKIKNSFRSKEDMNSYLINKLIYLIHKFEEDFLLNCNSFQITNSFIFDIFQFLNSELSHAESMVSKYNLSFSMVFNSLIKHLLCLIIKKADELQQSNYKREEQKYKDEKICLIKKAKEIYIMKRDEKKLGETVANDFINNLIDYLIQIETLSITNTSKEILNQNFKTPNDLVKFAFELSFEDSNYQNVYKYVIDVNRYCKEVCFENIKTDLGILISKKKQEIQILYHDLFVFFLDCNLSTEISSCKEFFKILEEDAKEKNKLLARLFNEKDSIIGTNISDFKLFIIGFKESIANFYNELNIKLEEFNNELDKRCKSEIIDYIDNYIGCNSRCPCCGSKCQNAKGHQGNHRSQFHILDGFYKWISLKNEIHTNFCWEEKSFTRLEYIIGDKRYKNCVEFLTNEHPDWLSDIQENYDEYGKNPSNSRNIRFRNQIMRAWMNTRKPLLKEYNSMNRKIEDKKYDKEWLSLEDAENMLPGDHVPKWNEIFNNFFEET